VGLVPLEPDVVLSKEAHREARTPSDMHELEAQSTKSVEVIMLSAELMRNRITSVEGDKMESDWVSWETGHNSRTCKKYTLDTA
jgi:hypothetical protein